MFYPEDMTLDDIMQLEFELNRSIDIERGEGLFWAVNAELQEIAAWLKEQATEVEADYLALMR